VESIATLFALLIKEQQYLHAADVLTHIQQHPYTVLLLCYSFFRVPYEIVKQRLQAGVYPNTLYALNAIYKESGVFGFFGRGGIITQLARDIPYAIVTLLVYESLQSYTAAQRQQRAAAAGSSSDTTTATATAANAVIKSTTLQNMLIGAIAGGIGTLATNPMDVVKTRMMTSPHLYAGALDVAVKTLQREGPLAFLRGATPRLLHKIPANGLFFAAFELFRALLGVKR
jgi:solute carrier family 25 (mitochondrial S-adenosylmethionine transporter), member 26